MATINLTKNLFNEKVANLDTISTKWKFLGDKPAIIDFYATWCGPCKMLSPVLEELSEEYAGKVDIYKVNVDSEEDLAITFGISSVPTLYFIPVNGDPKRALGALPKTQLKAAIEDML